MLPAWFCLYLQNSESNSAFGFPLVLLSYNNVRHVCLQFRPGPGAHISCLPGAGFHSCFPGYRHLETSGFQRNFSSLGHSHSQPFPTKLRHQQPWQFMFFYPSFRQTPQFRHFYHYPRGGRDSWLVGILIGMPTMVALPALPAPFCTPPSQSLWLSWFFLGALSDHLHFFIGFWVSRYL